MEKYFELSVRTKAQLADAATSVQKVGGSNPACGGGLNGSGGYQLYTLLML